MSTEREVPITPTPSPDDDNNDGAHELPNLNDDMRDASKAASTASSAPPLEEALALSEAVTSTQLAATPTLVPAVDLHLPVTSRGLETSTKSAFVDLCAAASVAAGNVLRTETFFFRKLVAIRDSVSVKAFKQARARFRTSYEKFRVSEAAKGRMLLPWGRNADDPGPKPGIGRRLAVYVTSKYYAAARYCRRGALVIHVCTSQRIHE